MAPGRPAMYPDQLGLVLLSVGMIAGGVYGVVKVLAG